MQLESERQSLCNLYIHLLYTQQMFMIQSINHINLTGCSLSILLVCRKIEQI